MDEIRFHCQVCDKHLVVDASGAGVTIQCPECQSPIVVPAPTQPAPIPPPIPAPEFPDGGPPCPHCTDPMAVLGFCQDSESESYPERGLWCHCGTCDESRRICIHCGQELRWIGEHAERGPNPHALRVFGCGCHHRRQDLARRALRSTVKTLALGTFAAFPLAVGSILLTSTLTAHTSTPVPVTLAALGIALTLLLLFVIIPNTAYGLWEVFWRLCRVSWIADLYRNLVFWILSLSLVALSARMLTSINWTTMPWTNFAAIAALHSITCYVLYHLARLSRQAISDARTLRTLRHRITRFAPWASALQSALG